MTSFRTDPTSKVSMVILNLDGYEDTRECLLSIRCVHYPSLEVILVNNGCSDDSPKRLLSEFPEVRVLTNRENLGYGGGCNLGIKDAIGRGADFVLLLNNDTIVDPDFLLNLIQIGETDPRIGILGPKIYYASDPQRIWFAGGFVKLKSGRYGHIGQDRIDTENKFGETREIGWITGCALLIRTSVFEKIGFLDSDLFAYFEDADFCLRARSAGYRCVFVPDAKVWHKVSRTSGAESPFTLYLGARNLLVWLSRHIQHPYKLGALAFAMTKKLARASLLLFVNPESAFALIRGVRAFFTNESGPPGKNTTPKAVLDRVAAVPEVSSTDGH